MYLLNWLERCPAWVGWVIGFSLIALSMARAIRWQPDPDVREDGSDRGDRFD